MFFKNLLKTKKYKKTNFLFDDFKNFLADDNKQTNLCYNFFVEDNALVNGLGFQNVTLPIGEGAETVRTIEMGSLVKCDLWHFPCFDKETNIRQDNGRNEKSDNDRGNVVPTAKLFEVERTI